MIVCVLWWAYIQFWSNASEKEDVSAKREADWSFQKPKVPETKLTDQEECALCGSRKESMTGMFSGKDAIGIISVNDCYIMDLKIKSGNEKGNMPERIRQGQRLGKMEEFWSVVQKVSGVFRKS